MEESAKACELAHGLLGPAFDLESGGGESLCRGRQVLEAEDGVEGVEQLRRPVLQKAAQLAVGKERSVGAEGLLPSETVEARHRLARPCNGDGTGGEVGARGPSAGDGGEARLSFNDKTGVDIGRVWVVKVAPTLLPGLALLGRPRS